MNTKDRKYRDYEFTVSGELEQEFYRELSPAKKEKIRQYVLSKRLDALYTWTVILGEEAPEQIRFEVPKNFP